MKKIKLSLVGLLITFGLNAQNWNINGANYTTGRVGIGTLSNSLIIDGTNVNNLVIGDASWSEGLVINANSNNDGILAFASDGSLVSRFIYNNPAGTLNYNIRTIGNVFTIDYKGSVGIGTTTPDSKLTVAGKIHSQEVKVTIDAGEGADFVFEENYELPSLQFIEEYVNAHNHLPEIASANEMEQNGLQLGEMSIKLLQKIEELTLYTIQQQKEINEQKDKIENQSKEIESLKTLAKRLTKIEEQLKKGN